VDAMQDIETALRGIIATIVETDADFPIEADLRDDLELDSHRAIEMVFEIERVFAIRIPNERHAQMRTLAGIMGVVAALGAAGG
jgi:acyl carrier protein